VHTPVQQSLFCWHVSPDFEQTQVPPEQTPTQHGDEAPQLSPPSAQADDASSVAPSGEM
jgi:hypothetical protein